MSKASKITKDIKPSDFIASIINRIPYKNKELIELKFKPSLIFSDDSNIEKYIDTEVSNFYCILIEFSEYAKISSNNKRAGFLDKKFALVGICDELPDFTKIYGLSNVIKTTNFNEELNNFISCIGYKLIDKDREDKIEKIKLKLTDDELNTLGLNR